MTLLAVYWPYLLIATGGVLAAFGGVVAAVKQNGFERDVRASLQETISSITGGDGYCSLEPFHMAYRPLNQHFMRLFNEGDHTCYDVGVQWTDVTRMVQMMEADIATHGSPREASIHDNQRWLRVGNVAKGNAVLPLLTLDLPATSLKQSYSFEVTARNGVTHGRVVFARVNRTDPWQSAVEIRRGEQVLRERIPATFPRDASGAVDW